MKKKHRNYITCYKYENMNMNLKTSSSFILVEIRLHQLFYFSLLPYDTEPTLFCILFSVTH